MWERVWECAAMEERTNVEDPSPPLYFVSSSLTLCGLLCGLAYPGPKMDRNEYNHICKLQILLSKI